MSQPAESGVHEAATTHRSRSRQHGRRRAAEATAAIRNTATAAADPVSTEHAPASASSNVSIHRRGVRDRRRQMAKSTGASATAAAAEVATAAASFTKLPTASAASAPGARLNPEAPIPEWLLQRLNVLPATEPAIIQPVVTKRKRPKTHGASLTERTVGDLAADKTSEARSRAQRPRRQKNDPPARPVDTKPPAELTQTHAVTRKPRVLRKRTAFLLDQLQLDGLSLAERLAQTLSSNTHDCMVCMEVVTGKQAIWSCSSCYQVFHLHCVRRWAHKSAEGGDEWRCPNCQNLSRDFPKVYTCFCGDTVDPPYDVRSSSVPHTCGNLCMRPLVRTGSLQQCGHTCSDPCHPGPCRPCMRPVVQRCYCQAASRQVPCSSTLVYSCEKICDRMLNCGVHRCSQPCHPDQCGDCTLETEQTCYCGGKRRQAVCGSGLVDEAKGNEARHFSCGKPCSLELDCEQHVCSKPCHQGTCGSCPRLPTAVRSCPCGQTPLFKLMTRPRTTCTDSIPTCGLVCGQLLPCGDPCPLRCHEGPHGACRESVRITCRCGSCHKAVSCDSLSAGLPSEFLCDTICGRLLSCRRHRCSLQCCPLRPNKDPAMHPCSRPCSKVLRCGDQCSEQCHRGHCPPCMNTLFEPLACACGETVLEPPLPCGTAPPVCNYPCAVPQPCGHPVTHTCHSTTIPCPPCPILIERACSGGHGDQKTVPCYQQSVSCGQPCSKMLPCGQHSCPESCHAGLCQDFIIPVAPVKVVARASDTFWGEDDEHETALNEGLLVAVQPVPLARPSCGLACGLRRDCGHPCIGPCHPCSPCPMIVCQEPVLLRCICGHRTVHAPCRFGEESMLAAAVARQYSGLRLTAGSLAKVKPGEETAVRNHGVAPCDRGCELARAAKQLEERNSKLARALAVQTSDFSGDIHEQYSDFLLTAAKNRAGLVCQLENTLRMFVLASSARQKPLPTMKSDDRRLCHELAEHYGLKSESVDPEPNRSVILFRSEWSQPRIPKPLLSETVLQGGSGKPC